MPRSQEVKDDYLEWFVEDEFVKDLEEAGWKVSPNMRIVRGWPDRICFGPKKRVVLIEFKRDKAPKKRRGEKLQKHYADEFRALGHEYHVIRGMEQARLAAEALVEGRKILLKKGS